MEMMKIIKVNKSKIKQTKTISHSILGNQRSSKFSWSLLTAKIYDAIISKIMDEDFWD